jgi:hypothetical protein
LEFFKDMEKNGVFLTNRNISILISIVVLSLFFVFISGYFFGKKKTIDKFYSKVDKESLADQVYYSVCYNYGNDDADQKQESTEENSSQEQQESSDLDRINNTVAQVDSAKLDVNLEGKSQVQEDDQNNTQENNNSGSISNKSANDFDEKPKEEFYAELVGFGTKNSATAFCNRLKKDGINVILKKRVSRSSRGRIMSWYQAVTEKFDNKRDLIAFVDIIKDKENLKSVKIVGC